MDNLPQIFHNSPVDNSQVELIPSLLVTHPPVGHNGAVGTGDPSRLSQLIWVDPATVTPNPRQPRVAFDEDSLAELAASIREVGLLQPIVVRPSDTGFELVAGERRLRASRLAGLSQLPALVRDTKDEELLREALLENLQRADLNPLEEAAAYRQLLDDFACSHDELAARVGKSRPHISNTLRLLRLPADVARRVAAGVLSAGHARALLALDDQAAMSLLAARIVAEGLSVRSVEEIVAAGKTGTERQRRPNRRRAVEQLHGVAEGLAGRLDTRVSVTMGQNQKGKVTIEFAGLDDLDRIVSLLTESAGPGAVLPADQDLAMWLDDPASSQPT